MGRSSTRFAQIPFVAISFALFASCETNPPAVIDPSGSWIYEALLTGAGVECLAGGLVQLERSGERLSGTYQNVNISCLDVTQDVLVERDIGSGTIVNGTVVSVAPSVTAPLGTSITFDFGNSSWRNVGTVLQGAGEERALTGSVTAQVDFGAPTGVLHVGGSWQAAGGGPIQNYSTLTVAVTGAGTVSSDPIGINCQPDCSQSYRSGSTVELTATAAQGWQFNGWGGSGTGCQETGPCTVAMIGHRSVTATFDQQVALTITGAGGGAGTITSVPIGINCTSTAGTTSGTCTAYYERATVVELSATASLGSSFSGWDGTAISCGNTGSCTVTLTETKSVRATFIQHGSLEVTSRTTGGSPDPDGYTIILDATQGQPIGLNSTVTFGSVAPGDHSLRLEGMASNCVVKPPNPRTVAVPSGSVTRTTFELDCPTPSGILEVTAVTTGGSPDPDGYIVTVDGIERASIGVNGIVTFDHLSAGAHVVQLEGLASNCTLTSSSPVTVNVPPGGTAQTTFEVHCPTPVGTLRVTTVTTGGTPDLTGYFIWVDDRTIKGINVNDTVTFPDLEAGNHSVRLIELASNCVVTGSNPVTVTISGGTTTEITFEVSCPTPPPGSVLVSTITTGPRPDPDGYQVFLDVIRNQPIGVNATVVFENVSAGDHYLRLEGHASNCVVAAPNPVIVTIPPGGSAQITFEVDCPIPLGTLHVATVTTGGNPDPDGFTVTVDGIASQSIAVNGFVTFTNLLPGNHSVQLSGLASNCVLLEGVNPRGVDLPEGGVAQTTFAVFCPVLSTLVVATTTTGSSVDPDGYTVTLDGIDSRAIGINGEVRFRDVLPGDHSVHLTGVAANCAVDGSNPTTVTIPENANTGFGFDVTCQSSSPTWRFSIIAGVTEQTSNFYGGYASVSSLIRAQMGAVTSRFNEPRVFAADFEFVVESVYVFSGDVAAEICKPHSSHDLRIVYDAFPPGDGGWRGDCQAIYHSWPASSFDGIFANYATDGLTHELGHARGAVDLYALEVNAANNPISGQSYRAEVSIMNSPYGIRIWDAHSVYLINATNSIKAPPIQYITSAFPPTMGVTVVNSAGAPIAGATVELFPVSWFSGSTDATAVLTGVTDGNGRFVFPRNPFEPNDPGFPWFIRYCNFVTRVTMGTDRSFAWLPLTTVQVFSFANPGTPFWLTVAMTTQTSATGP